MIVLKALSKYWVFEAFREAWSKPWSKKWKHLKYRILWELRPMLKLSGSTPLAVDVELVSRCNFRCVFCQKTDNEFWKDNEETDMTWELFTHIVDECANIGVYSMKLNWRGEPMLHPHLVECIQYIKKRGIHEVMMNSNASKLTSDLCEKLVASGIDRIIFSCDGISKDTYNNIRRGGDWDKFFDNITMFREACTRAKMCGKPIPIVRINTAIMEENLHEIPHFRQKFGNLIDELRFNTLYNPQQQNKNLGGRKRQTKRKGCPQIYQRMIVSAQGDAVPCCADYKKQLNLGNIMSKPLSSMFQKDMGKIRDEHEAGRGRQIKGCAKCDLFSLSKTENGKMIWV